MTRKITLLLGLLAALFLSPNASSAQVQEGTLIGNWQDPSLPEMFYGIYNEVWGVVVNDVEYGVIGSTMGTHFISLEPDVDGNLTEVQFVPGAAQGSSIIHRDFHSYGNYLYAVADEGASSLQVIDFSDLPNSVSVVYDDDEFIYTSHNIFIDEPNALLYSTNGAVLSLANPAQPVQLINTNMVMGHDIFVRDNIVFVNKGNPGLFVYDFTDPTNAVALGSMTDYPNSGYNHSGWMSDDGQHYFLCDETGGRFVKSVSIDDLSDMEVVDMFKADNNNPQHIAHNAIVLNNLLYVSYYSDGIQVFDISDPENVVRKYYYDTFPGVDNSGFKGAWGVYPLLPSGRVLASDFDSGLSLISFPADKTIFTLDDEVNGCEDDNISFEILIGADFDAAGVNLSASGAPAGANVTFSANPAMPNDIVTVEVSDLADATDFAIDVVADDGSANAGNSTTVDVYPNPPALTLEVPADGSTGIVFNNPSMGWEFNPDVNHTFEISAFADFSVILESQDVGPLNSVTISSILSQNAIYYWRVISTNDCGSVTSEAFSFTTASIVGTNDILAQAVSISPNPAHDELMVKTGDYLQGTLDITLLDVTGKQIGNWSIDNNDAQFSLMAPAGLQGVYFLRIAGVDGVLAKRVLFAR